jgi:hypothetical protein
MILHGHTGSEQQLYMKLQRIYFYFVDRFEAVLFMATSALLATHINLADESKYQMADNVWNEGK